MKRMIVVDNVKYYTLRDLKQRSSLSEPLLVLRAKKEGFLYKGKDLGIEIDVLQEKNFFHEAFVNSLKEEELLSTTRREKETEERQKKNQIDQDLKEELLEWLSQEEGEDKDANQNSKQDFNKDSSVPQDSKRKKISLQESKDLQKALEEKFELPSKEK